jgi:formylglycine-generating enzyme required for sulfatase activity
MPRAANRIGYDPHYRDADIGFRCARDAVDR